MLRKTVALLEGQELSLQMCPPSPSLSSPSNLTFRSQLVIERFPPYLSRMVRENDRLLEVQKQLHDKLEKRTEGFSIHTLNVEARKKSL
jgi:hypothetical protein